MLKRVLKIRELVILLAVLITVLVFYLIQPGEGNRFLTLSNLEAILLGMSLDGLIAIGRFPQDSQPLLLGQAHLQSLAHDRMVIRNAPARRSTHGVPNPPIRILGPWRS